MKVQLRGQSIRLRIDETELEDLLRGDELVNVTGLGAGVAYRQIVCLGDGEDPQAEAAEGVWKLRVPGAQVRRLASSLPCREGLAFALPAGSGVLHVGFEVDVRDSMRVRGPRHGEHECSPSLPN